MAGRTPASSIYSPMPRRHETNVDISIQSWILTAIVAGLRIIIDTAEKIQGRPEVAEFVVPERESQWFGFLLNRFAPWIGSLLSIISTKTSWMAALICGSIFKCCFTYCGSILVSLACALFFVFDDYIMQQAANNLAFGFCLFLVVTVLTAGQRCARERPTSWTFAWYFVSGAAALTGATLIRVEAAFVFPAYLLGVVRSIWGRPGTGTFRRLWRTIWGSALIAGFAIAVMAGLGLVTAQSILFRVARFPLCRFRHIDWRLLACGFLVGGRNPVISLLPPVALVLAFFAWIDCRSFFALVVSFCCVALQPWDCHRLDGGTDTVEVRVTILEIIAVVASAMVLGEREVRWRICAAPFSWLVLAAVIFWFVATRLIPFPLMW